MGTRALSLPPDWSGSRPGKAAIGIRLNLRSQRPPRNCWFSRPPGFAADGGDGIMRKQPPVLHCPLRVDSVGPGVPARIVAKRGTHHAESTGPTAFRPLMRRLRTVQRQNVVGRRARLPVGRIPGPVSRSARLVQDRSRSSTGKLPASLRFGLRWIVALLDPVMT